MRVRHALMRHTAMSATAVVAVSATVAAGLSVPAAAAATPARSRLAAAPLTLGRVAPRPVVSGRLSSLAGAEAAASPAGPVELPSLRTATSDTYDLGDGTYRTVVAAGPVNYATQGGWAPIDDTLVPAAGGWTERANAYAVSLPTTGDGPVKIAAGGAWISYQLTGAAAVPGKVSGSSVSYPNVLPGVTAVYTATPSGVKESLLLASAAAAPSAVFTETSSAGVSMTPTAGGGLAVVTGGGSRVFTLPPVTVSDGAGAQTMGTLTAGVGAGGATTVTAAVDPGWLAAAGRAFPVDVDPSTVLPVGGPGDCALYNGLGSTCTQTILAAGLNAGSWHARSIAYFDTSAIQADDTVLGADLTLTVVSGTVGTSGRVTSLPMDLHALTRGYTSAASWANYDGTHAWTTAGGDFSATVQASATAGGPLGYPAAVDFTPTAMVAGWVSGKTVNDGLIVVPQNESGLASNDGYVNFASAEASSGQPSLAVIYIPKVGDAGSYTTIKRTVDDRATVKVNVGSGNLYAANNDVTIANPGVNLTVSRYNNSRSPLHPSMSLGWGLSGIDTELVLNTDGSVTSVDDTGRQTLYAKTGSTWTAPAGGNASLTQADATHYVLTANGGGDQRTFTDIGDGTAAQLTSDVDRNGNGVTWTRSGTHTTAITSTADATHTLSVSYDGSGRVHQIGDWTGRTWTYGYDPTSGALSTYTDPNSKATSYSYNTNAILTGITTPRGNQTTIGYTATHNMVASVQQTVSGTSGPTTGFGYNGFTGTSATSTVTDPDSHTTTYTYDPSDRVTHTADPLGHTRDTSWTANDAQATLTDGLSAVTTLSHDTLNNPTKSQAPNTSGGVTGRTSSLGYPTAGSAPYPQSDYQATSSTDAQGKATNYSYTTTGNLATLTPPSGTGGTAVTNAYQGDAGVPSCGGLTGQRCSSTDGIGHKTIYGYTSTGQLTAVTPPAPLGATTTSYDTAGRPNAVTDGKSQTTRSTYDGDDRITELQFGGTTTCTTSDISGGRCITYSYDGDGNLTGRADSTGSTIWAYDTLNRPKSKTIPGASTPSSVGYDAAGNVTSYVDAGGTVGYTYDPANQLWALAEPGGSCPAYSTTPVPVPNSTRCTGFTVDNAGHRTGINYPSGEKIALGYDTSGRQASITAKRPSGTAFFTRTIGYQTAGATPADTGLVQQTVDSPGGTTTDSYDQLSRLTTAAVGSTSYGYAYDPAGNRTSSTVTGQSTSYYGYNNADQLCWSGTTSGSNGTTACPTTPSGDTGYSYDADGNQTAGGLTFTYNAANQTTGITNAGTLTSLGYADANQTERTTSTTSGTATTLLNGLVGLTAQTIGSGTTSYFTRDPDGNLISLRVGAGSGSNNSYYLLDQQASVLRLTDATGNTDTATYTYDPYGRTLTASGTQATTSPYRYATAYYDTATGLYKLGARYYNPTVGRFTQLDPKGGGYVYAGDSPSISSDPSGLFQIYFSYATSLDIAYALQGAAAAFGVAAAISAILGNAPVAIIALIVGLVLEESSLYIQDQVFAHGQCLGYQVNTYAGVPYGGNPFFYSPCGPSYEHGDL